MKCSYSSGLGVLALIEMVKGPVVPLGGVPKGLGRLVLHDKSKGRLAPVPLPPAVPLGGGPNVKDMAMGIFVPVISVSRDPRSRACHCHHSLSRYVWWSQKMGSPGLSWTSCICRRGSGRLGQLNTAGEKDNWLCPAGGEKWWEWARRGNSFSRDR